MMPTCQCPKNVKSAIVFLADQRDAAYLADRIPDEPQTLIHRDGTCLAAAMACRKSSNSGSDGESRL
jgi:hypothetical protein